MSSTKSGIPKQYQVAVTHSEGLSCSGEEEQRSVREGFLEEMGLELELEGKRGGVRIVKRSR